MSHHKKSALSPIIETAIDPDLFDLQHFAMLQDEEPDEGQSTPKASSSSACPASESFSGWGPTTSQDHLLSEHSSQDGSHGEALNIRPMPHIDMSFMADVSAHTQSPLSASDTVGCVSLQDLDLGSESDMSLSPHVKRRGKFEDFELNDDRLGKNSTRGYQQKRARTIDPLASEDLPLAFSSRGSFRPEAGSSRSSGRCQKYHLHSGHPSQSTAGCDCRTIRPTSYVITITPNYGQLSSVDPKLTSLGMAHPRLYRNESIAGGQKIEELSKRSSQSAHSGVVTARSVLRKNGLS